MLIPWCVAAFIFLIVSAAPNQPTLPPMPLLPPDPFPHIGVPEPNYLDFIIHNMDSDSPDFFTIRVSNCLLDVNEVQVRMANHVERKLFKILSVTATERAYVVVCVTKLSHQQLDDGCEGDFFPDVWERD